MQVFVNAPSRSLWRQRRLPRAMSCDLDGSSWKREEATGSLPRKEWTSFTKLVSLCSTSRRTPHGPLELKAASRRLRADKNSSRSHGNDAPLSSIVSIATIGVRSCFEGCAHHSRSSDVLNRLRIGLSSGCVRSSNPSSRHMARSPGLGPQGPDSEANTPA